MTLPETKIKKIAEMEDFATVTSIGGKTISDIHARSHAITSTDDHSDVVTTTWTPALKFGGNSVDMTYDAQTGYYTKVGNVVFFRLYIILTNKGTSEGAATVSLPIAPATIQCEMPIISVTAMPSPASKPDLWADAVLVGTYLGLMYNNAGAAGALTNADFANNSAFVICGFYFV